MGIGSDVLNAIFKRDTPASTSVENVRAFPSLADAKDPDSWIPEIYAYVESEATKAIDWYLQKSRGKRLGSRWIRYWAVMLGGVAGLLPIISMIGAEAREIWRVIGSIIVSSGLHEDRRSRALADIGRIFWTLRDSLKGRSNQCRDHNDIIDTYLGDGSFAKRKHCYTDAIDRARPWQGFS